MAVDDDPHRDRMIDDAVPWAKYEVLATLVKEQGALIEKLYASIIDREMKHDGLETDLAAKDAELDALREAADFAAKDAELDALREAADFAAKNAELDALPVRGATDLAAMDAELDALRAAAASWERRYLEEHATWERQHAARSAGRTATASRRPSAISRRVALRFTAS
ncbi:hypothetical protein M885DRAFT_561685 [Pelagophyceae sp. CCMP2097]|nr:hypothetical protein M885DRAFT_561685 [Pelagophyceae sp. CCMP2097]